MLLGFALTSARAQFPSQLNLSLVGSHEPPQAATGYGDVWGDGQIACLGTWTAYATFGLGIYSITNPASPQLLTVYNFGTTAANRFEQGVIRSNILYVGSWGGSTTTSGGSGVHILSITNPAAPALLRRITAATPGTVNNGFDNVHTLFLERDFLYIAAHNVGVVSVKVFNVNNPAAPVFLRDIVTTNTTKVHQITVRPKGAQTLLFTSGWGGNDNSNPASPGQTDIWDVTQIGTQPAQWLGRIYSGYNSHSSWPTPDGNTLIVCRELTGGDVRFYDISNPATIPTNATPLVTLTPASMGIEADIPHNPVIVSNFLFLSWYQNGIQAFDITDRTNPIRVGYFDTYPGNKSSSFQGNWGVYPWLGFNKILLSDIQSGLFVVNGMALLTPTNNYPPLIAQPPASITVTQGFTAKFTPSITGSLLKYQWRFNGTPIANATNATLTLNNVQTNEAGSYMVSATNNFGAVTSAVAVLSVVLPTSTPIISSQPQDLAVYPDNPATFNVGVVGAAPFGFQWRFNGVQILNATNQSFTRDPALPEHVGYYSVVVSNSFGNVTSTNALLTMLDSPYVNSVAATPGARSALISWNTTTPADSQVQYEVASTVFSSPNSVSAAAASLGLESYIDTRLTTNHLILLTGLAPGTRYSFQTLATSGTNAYVSGVYQFTTAGTNIVDNPAASFTGAWTIGTSSVDKFSTNYAFATSVAGTTNATAIFSPNLSTAGEHDVAVWYPQGGNRANNAPYTINFNSGSTTVPVNQQAGGGMWQTIGSGIEFAKGAAGNVTLANNANPTVVIADAVRFAYIEAQDFPTNSAIPNWWRNYFFGGPTDANADPDGDGFSTAEEYLIGTSPTDASSSLRVVAQADASAARITFWPYLGNRSYQLLVRTNVNDANWQAYQPANIQATPYGHGIFTIPLTNAPHRFFRVQVQWSIIQSTAGSFQIQAARSASNENDATCGPYRVFVRPAGNMQ